MAIPVDEETKKCLSHDLFKKRYANSTLRSIKVVFAREFMLVSTYHLAL